MWVSVSKTFDENDLLRDVIGSAKGDPSEANSRSQLESRLVDAVRGKKLLLVLDDVWDVSVWDRLLRNPLSRCASGSRILLTTKNEGVARQMKAVDLHQMDFLPLEDGWSLLCKKLVLSGREEEVEHLKDIGLQIVDKCGGLPLAINAMVPVLCTKTRRDWEHVLGSPAWSVSGLPEEVNKALYVSYLDLPSRLKQCFLYCFLLPKGYEITREGLIKLWIAEGFIKSQDESSTSMEEIGEVYYRELTGRNLLQRDLYGLTYNMHDLLRSLAAFLAQDESLLIEAQDESFPHHDNLMKLRRLSLLGKEINADVSRNRESLRTLILYKYQSTNLDGVLDHLSFLRVLDLRCSKIEELPESLASLAHLRFLNLQETLISRLPENIGNLKNLQALNLKKCDRLDRLPNGVVTLKNLRGLNILGTRVEGIPAGIGRLCQLRNLGGYRLHSLQETNTITGDWSTLEELGSLSQLRLLVIDNLEMASGSPEATAVPLMEKSHLIHLHLRCRHGWIDDATNVDIKRIVDVFESLQPPSCVEMLHIVGFPGSRFPRWMTRVFYDLRFLELDECNYCENLPPLGQLPNLIHLHIMHWQSVTAIGPEFMGAHRGDLGSGESTLSSTYIAFPKLQKLIFKKMLGWQMWQWETGSHAMPCLDSLELYDCPKLVSLPKGLSHHATALRELTIEDADSLESVGQIDSLKELIVVNCPCLERVFNFPALKILEINNCQSLSNVGSVYSLQFIVLTDRETNSLPEWLSEDEGSPKPEKLDIYCNEQLFEKILQRGPEDWPKIQRINHVEIDYDVGHASYTKCPYSFNVTSYESIRHPSRIRNRGEPPVGYVLGPSMAAHGDADVEE